MNVEDNNENVGINDDNQDDFEASFYGNSTASQTIVDEEETEEVVEEEVVEDSGEEEVETPATEDDEDEDEPEEEEKPKGKNRKSAQERINELTADKHEERRLRLALEKRLAELEAAVTKVEKEEPQALREKLPSGAPDPDAKLEDGETPKYKLGEFDPEYVRDLTKFMFEQEMKAAKEVAQKEAAEAQMKAAQQELANNWLEKLEKYEEEVPDVRDSIKDLTDTFEHIEPAYGEYLASTIMMSEVGPQIMHYLSQNIGEAQKIVASGPAAATLALGRLEARLTKSTPEEKKSNTKRVSEAPPPPENRVRGVDGKYTVKPDTDDQDAFERIFYQKK